MFLLLSVAVLLAYVVGGYLAVKRFAAGDRSTRVVLGTVLAVLGGLYVVFVPLLDGELLLPSLIPPAAHGFAAWRGRAATPAP